MITVGRQIARLFELHRGLPARAAWERGVEALDQVGVPEAPRRMRQYAHQLSGGTCQRVMIAMALASSPQLLIADEPTTGLDVSIAARILDLLRELGSRTGAAIILITHDLGVVAETCHRVSVMHAGQLVEIGLRAHAVPATNASLHARPGAFDPAHRSRGGSRADPWFRPFAAERFPRMPLCDALPGSPGHLQANFAAS